MSNLTATLAEVAIDNTANSDYTTSATAASEASEYSAEPVSDPRSLASWVIKHDENYIGAAWIDEDSGKVFFHIMFTDGKLHGKAKLLKQLIPFGAWITVPISMFAGAKYLERYVGMTMHESIWFDGQLLIPMERK